MPRRLQRHEVELVYLTANQSHNNHTLAALLDRSLGSIQWIHRYCDDQDDIGPRSSRVILGHVLEIVRDLGVESRSLIQHLDAQPGLQLSPRDVRTLSRQLTNPPRRVAKLNLRDDHGTLHPPH